MALITKTLYVIWALPNTALGMGLGGVVLLAGGGARFREGAMEFYGPAVRWGLGRFASAITFGHAILGLDEAVLDACRDHERVHVRQYERWGPVFLPAYVLCWMVLKVQGRDGYRENPFERQAYDETE